MQVIVIVRIRSYPSFSAQLTCMKLYDTSMALILLLLLLLMLMLI